MTASATLRRSPLTSTVVDRGTVESSRSAVSQAERAESPEQWSYAAHGADAGRLGGNSRHANGTQDVLVTVLVRALDRIARRRAFERQVATREVGEGSRAQPSI